MATDLKARLRWPRVTIGAALGAIASLAVGCARPLLIVPAVAAVLVALLCRAGFTVVEGIVMVATLGVLLALCMPSVVAHRAALAGVVAAGASGQPPSPVIPGP